MKRISVYIFFLTFLLLCSCGDSERPRFRLLKASKTGIDFSNTIEENDSINVFKFMNIYTGAGVAVGDVNNDGLTDVYFSGNMVSGRLYQNKGDMEFEDISESSGILNGRWGTGATMVDINQDGWLDIYICVSGSAPEKERANMLYINNGLSDDSNTVTFTERASEYGLADTRQSMHAAFFDFDKDQDLDMYLLVNPAAYEYRVNTSQPRKLDGTSVNNDRLYRNEGNGTFMDVTKEAGILVEGYGLGVGVSDINKDGWPDIYVSNDFIGNDIMYINQADGTFKDEISQYINHTSYAGMGNDIADIDNNGQPDIMVLDMRPEDNERQKLIISSTGYDRFQTMLDAGYDPQYSRNTLQLNHGEGEFSEIGFMAGVSSTDWSWSPLLADYDNDGLRDLYVTNGFLRDLGNLDYIHYQNVYDNPLGDPQTKIDNKLNSIKELPNAKLVNYFYKNGGNNAAFEDVTESWGIEEASCSNGAAYADLDNDGDLDILVNNVNQKAFVYENLSEKDSSNNFLRIRLIGKNGNRNGIGARVTISSDSLSQYYEHFLSRGYESSVDPIIHFGLAEKKKIDKVEVWWPNDTYQILTDVQANQLLKVDQSNARTSSPLKIENPKKVWFTKVTDSLEIDFVHEEDNMVDFKLQPILPHMHSRNGPGISVSDVNGDGLEDFYVGGAAGQEGRLMLQRPNGSFDESGWSPEKMYEDMGCLFFDADADGDNDLYVVSGGVLPQGGDESYQDRLYLNDGSGNFSRTNALPEINSSGSLVTASDFDRDGDLDLFVGGRVTPGKYPMPAQSYLLENLTDKHPGTVKFRRIEDQIEAWDKLTMVSAALWTDYNNDGWTDLIAVGEFMPIVIFHNDQGKLILQKETGLYNTEGWWNSIAGGDFDNDGDTDYILGNLGLNNRYNASAEEPVCIYAKDYDKDGRIDPIMCYYNEGENYLAHSRDEIIGQISAMRGRFKTYQSYAENTFERSFLPEELADAYVVKSHNFASSYLENLGGGKFELKKLPVACQAGPVDGIVVEDFDMDGNLDVLLSGNSYSPEVSTGRQDAIKGIVLKGNGKGGFAALELQESGFLNDYDGSGLAMIKNPNGKAYVLSANSNGPLNAFETVGKGQSLPVDPNCSSAEIFYMDGTRRKHEFYHGSGYLSQSSRSILIGDNVKQVKTTDFNEKTTTIYEVE